MSPFKPLAAFFVLGCLTAVWVGVAFLVLHLLLCLNFAILFVLLSRMRH